MQEIASSGFQIMREALCRALDCQPGDILEYISEEKCFLFSVLQK